MHCKSVNAKGRYLVCFLLFTSLHSVPMAVSQLLQPSPPPAESFQAGLDTGVLEISDYQTGMITFEEITRSYSYYVPNRSPNGDYSMVVALHGGTTNARNIPLSHENRWRHLAELHGLIILVPEGIGQPLTPDSRHWNDCRADVTNPPDGGVNDVGYITALIDWADQSFGVDQSRVYCVGESNGGLMTLRLAQEVPERFAAVATSIASMAAQSECNARGIPIPILLMTGTADWVVPAEGGSVYSPTAGRGTVRPVTEMVDYWVMVNQANPTPTVVDLPDVVAEDLCTVTRLHYRSESTHADVLHYRINNGGHRTPGPSWVAPIDEMFGQKNRDIWAADEMWAFFSRFPVSN